jgi:hypothetical protein
MESRTLDIDHSIATHEPSWERTKRSEQIPLLKAAAPTIAERHGEPRRMWRLRCKI